MSLDLPIQPEHQSLESLKEVYQQRLDAILYSQLTVENIETFAKEALSKMVDLVDDLLVEYKNNPGVRSQEPPLSSSEQEDVACQIFSLPNISEILDEITKVGDTIDSLKIYLDTQTEQIETIITPPQPDHMVEKREGTGDFKKRISPRLLTLLYIIKHDFELAPEDVEITQGSVNPKMMRQTPYVRVKIPNLNRVVYVCDEEGNASYIFDLQKLEKIGLTPEAIDLYDKEDRNSLINQHAGIGIRILQSKNWRSNMTTALEEEITSIQSESKNKQTVRKSEFEKKIFLLFPDFQNEVKNKYQGQKNIQRWYVQEQKEHENWSSQPHTFYKDKGWIGWPEFVGKENRLKKIKELPFLDFQNEVKNKYQGQKNKWKWYNQEKRKHENWPADPSDFYKDKGWIGWPEFVGRENRRKKMKELPFLDFQNEVRNKYQGQTNIPRWYDQEKLEHENWPYDPSNFYKDRGWIGWPEFVGKERKNDSKNKKE